MDSPQDRASRASGFIAAARRGLTSPYVAAAFAMLCWAGSTVAVRFVREDVPPMGLSFWRGILGFLILLPFVIAPLREQAGLIRANWKILALLGLLLVVGGNAMLFLALQYTIAINAALINSVEPVIIVVLAWLLFRDPFTRRQGFGVAVSLVGVLVLISGGSLESIGRLDFNQGDLIVAGAYVSWGLYAVMLRKAPRGLDHRLVLLAILGFGSLLLLPLYLIETAVARPVVLSWTTVWSVALLALISSVLAALMWNYAIVRLGAGRAGLFIHLIPAFTVVMAIALLDEVLRQFHITGIALIGVGIYFSSVVRRSAETTS